jgi:hypothetical protein
MAGRRGLDSAESADDAEHAPNVVVPEEFRHLEERERVQGMSLRKLFAEQEHGLRQKYADWIIWLLGLSLWLLTPFSWRLRGQARAGI